MKHFSFFVLLFGLFFIHHAAQASDTQTAQSGSVELGIISELSPRGEAGGYAMPASGESALMKSKFSNQSAYTSNDKTRSTSQQMHLQWTVAYTEDDPEAPERFWAPRVTGCKFYSNGTQNANGWNSATKSGESGTDTNIVEPPAGETWTYGFTCDSHHNKTISDNIRITTEGGVDDPGDPVLSVYHTDVPGSGVTVTPGDVNFLARIGNGVAPTVGAFVGAKVGGNDSFDLRLQVALNQSSCSSVSNSQIDINVRVKDNINDVKIGRDKSYAESFKYAITTPGDHCYGYKINDFKGFNSAAANDTTANWLRLRVVPEGSISFQRSLDGKPWSAQGALINAGEQIKLRWNSSNVKSGTCSVRNITTNSTLSTASSNYPSGANITEPSAGSAHTYRLSCEDFQGKLLSKDIKIEVRSLPTASINVPSSVNYGDSVNITWSSQNATSCTAQTVGASSSWSGNKSTGGTESSGAISTLNTPIKFRVRCQNDNGVWSGWKEKTVTVVPPPPTAEINAPNAVDYGGAVNVTWDSENATSCAAQTIDNGNQVSSNWSGTIGTGGTRSSGSIQTSSNKIRFAVRCRNDSGTWSSWANKDVTVRPRPTAEINAPNSVNYGDAVDVTWDSENAVSCTARTTVGGSPFASNWSGTIGTGGTRSSGSIKRQVNSIRFSVRCRNAVGLWSDWKNKDVNVLSVDGHTFCPNPAVINSDKKVVNRGGAVELSWYNLDDTVACELTGPGVSQSVNGCGEHTYTINPNNISQYKLTCGGVEVPRPDGEPFIIQVFDTVEET